MHIPHSSLEALRKHHHTLTEKGFSHIVLPLLAFIAVGGIGGYVIYAHAEGAPPTTAERITLKSGLAGDKCLDDYHDSATEGNIIDIYGCNNTASQEWTLKTEKVGDLIENVNGTSCIDNWLAANKSNNPIKIYDCNAYDTAQLWYVSGNTLKNTQTGMCITDPSNVTTDGTELRLDPCVSGAKDQQWTPTEVTTTATTPPTTTLSISSAPTAPAADITTKAATITWTTSIAATSSLEWDLSEVKPPAVNDGTATTTNHSLQMTGLSPKSTYTYEVTSTANGKTVTDRGTVTTKATTTTTTGSGGSGGGVTTTASCTDPVYTDTTNDNNYADPYSSGIYQIFQNVWNAQNGVVVNGKTENQTQSLYVCSYHSWYVVASVPGSTTSHTVTTYPEAEANMKSTPISDYKTLTSSYGDQDPSTSAGSYEYAYDIWVDGGPGSGTEIMIWNDVHGQSPAGSAQGNVTIDGTNFTYWSNGGTDSFVDNSRSTSGTWNLLPFFSYLEGKKAFGSNTNPVLTYIDYGVEVAPNGFTPTTFRITNFSVSDTE
jgi:hypothetical protein